MAAAGCGGDDDAPKTGAAGTTAAALKAADLVPDLGPLGYTLVQQGRDPAAIGSADVYRALWQKGQTSPKGALAAIYVFADANTATQQFTILADALRNPPPDYLGGAKATFDPAPSPKVGDQQRSYATKDPDGQGNRAWTDIYRVGRVVAIIQLLDSAQSDQVQLRTTLAGKIQEKVR